MTDDDLQYLGLALTKILCGALDSRKEELHDLGPFLIRPAKPVSGGACWLLWPDADADPEYLSATPFDTYVRIEPQALHYLLGIAWDRGGEELVIDLVSCLLSLAHRIRTARPRPQPAPGAATARHRAMLERLINAAKLS